MITQSDVQSIVSANNSYKSSLKRGTGIKASKQRLMNVLFGCAQQLIDMASGSAVSAVSDKELDELKAKITSLENDLKSLNDSLIESDKQNDELRKQLKALAVNGSV